MCRVAADELDGAVADPDESRYTRSVLVSKYHTLLNELTAKTDELTADLDDLLGAVRQHTDARALDLPRFA